MDADGIADFSAGLMQNAGSLLIICNTKSEARAIYRKLKALPSGAEVYHLSTNMCQKHREDRLGKIQDALNQKQKVICVSTQMVEAGVDISFESVIRIMAGLDNLIQSAGRCNRSCEFGYLCKVYLIRYKGERLSHLDDIKRSQDSMISLLVQFEQHPDLFDRDICSEKSIAYFYKNLLMGYERNGLLDYPAGDSDTLLELLSTNSSYVKRSRNGDAYFLQQAFKTAGHAFTVYDEGTVDVIVPYCDGKKIIGQLCSEAACRNIGYRKKLFRQAGTYSIQLWQSQLAEYLGKGIVQQDGKINDFYVLNQAYYRDGTDGGNDIGIDPDVYG